MHGLSPQHQSRTYLAMIILVSAACIVSSTLYGTAEYHKIYRAPRTIGYGGGATAASVGSESFFDNPAGFAFVNRSQFDLVNMQIEFGKDDYDLLFTDFDGLNGFEEVLTFVRQYLGKNIHYGHRTLVNYYRPGMGVAMLLDSVALNLKVKMRGLFPEVGYELVAYNGVFVANGLKLKVKKGELGVGMTVKYLMKGISQVTLSGDDLLRYKELKSDFKEKKNSLFQIGSAPGLDLGFLYRRQFNRFKGSLGILAENVFHVRYAPVKKVKTLEVYAAPAWDRFNMAMGLFLESPRFWLFRTKYFFDLRNLLSEGIKYKKVHFGFELAFEEPRFNYQTIMIRTGYNQGNFSYGIGLDFWTIQFDFAKYGEEIADSGEISGIEGDTDTRYIFNLRMGF